jgi:hypothetical protein
MLLALQEPVANISRSCLISLEEIAASLPRDADAKLRRHVKKLPLMVQASKLQKHERTAQ